LIRNTQDDVCVQYKHEIMGIHRTCMDLQSCATNYNPQC
jgi:hypothetical protein